jgi:hypothetical protein
MWLKHLIVATAVSMVVAKLFELFLARDLLVSAVNWEVAQLDMLASIAPWELGERFWTAMQTHSDLSWYRLPLKAIAEVMNQTEGTFAYWIIIGEVVIAFLITLFAPKDGINGWIAIPPIFFLEVMVVASLLNMAVYFSYAVVLHLTLPILRLGVFAFGAGVAGGTGWTILHGTGVFAVKAAETATSDAVTRVTKRGIAAALARIVAGPIR